MGIAMSSGTLTCQPSIARYHLGQYVSRFFTAGIEEVSRLLTSLSDLPLIRLGCRKTRNPHELTCSPVRLSDGADTVGDCPSFVPHILQIRPAAPHTGSHLLCLLVKFSTRQRMDRTYFDTSSSINVLLLGSEYVSALLIENILKFLDRE